MRAWFDIKGMDRSFEVEEKDVLVSENQVRTLIQRENLRGIPFSRIFLAGFSQGGSITLQTGLRYPETLAGGDSP